MLQAGADSVHVFEPEPQNVAVLRESFAAEPRVTVHGIAVSDADRTLELHVSTYPDGGLSPSAIRCSSARTPTRSPGGRP